MEEGRYCTEVFQSWQGLTPDLEGVRTSFKVGGLKFNSRNISRRDVLYLLEERLSSNQRGRRSLREGVTAMQIDNRKLAGED